MSPSPGEPPQSTGAPSQPWETLPLAVARFDAQGTFQGGNSRFFQWLSLLPQEPPSWPALRARLLEAAVSEGSGREVSPAAAPSWPSPGLEGNLPDASGGTFCEASDDLPPLVQVRGQDGLMRALELHLTAENGHRVCTLLDVSAWSERLAEAMARERWLSQVLHRSPYPVVLFDQKGHFREANQAFVDYWHGQLPPPEYTFLDDPLGAQQLGPDFMAKLHRGEACRSEEFWWNPHKLNPAWPDIDHCLELIIEPIRAADGRLDGFMLIYDDRTELKRIQERVLGQQRLESVGQLAASIAHDFNNYLTSIFAHVSLAERNLEDPEAMTDRLHRIRAVSRAAASLTYQLVTYSRGGEPLLERVALGPLVEDAVGFSLRGSAVEVIMDLPEEAWVVEVDPGQIRQVISNLVLNALQAMEDHGKLTLRLQNLPHSDLRALGDLAGRGDFVRISIEDTGPGIPLDVQSRVFEPFFTTRSAGQGLGLTTARDIARKHLGRLTVHSAPGQGTRFDLFLPALPFARVEAAPRTPLFRGFGAVLLMDDDTDLREATEAMLVYLGYDVLAAPNGEAALALFDDQVARGKAVSVAIADYTVRGAMGGLGLLEALRDRDPEVPVILSSGYADGPVMSRFAELGFSARLAKPYDLQELSDAVYHQLPHVRLRQPPQQPSEQPPQQPSEQPPQQPSEQPSEQPPSPVQPSR